MPNPSKKFNLLINMGLLLASTILILLSIEFVSRFIFPISHGTQFLNLKGEPIKIHVDSWRFRSNLKARQVSMEYDVRVNFTALGYRAPEVKGNPDVIFIGDSFTFGYGLNDEETFVFRFCERAGLSCANLGRFGTGTIWQIKILEHFLQTEGWRPSEVNLFMFLMTKSFTAGNDFDDILKNKVMVEPREAPPADLSTNESAFEKIIHLKKWVLGNSNLVRIVYYFFTPVLREKFSPAPHEERKQAAYKIMRDQIRRLDKVADHYQFTCKIYVLHPMQDITRGSYVDTLKTIREIVNQAAPGIKVIETASAMLDDPLSYYYKFDGRLNSKGSAKITEILWKEWKEEEKNKKG